MPSKQYSKDCRDCGKRIYMLEQTNGSWRAYDDAQHNMPHECQKNLQPPASSPATQPSSTQLPAKSEPGFSDLQQDVIRRIVLDEMKKRLGSLRSLFE